MQLLYRLIKGDITEQVGKVQETQNQMNNRLSDIENELKNVSATTSQNQTDIKTLQQNFKEIKTAHESLQEKADRLTRMNNLVIMNIPEDDNALNLLAELMQIILPGNDLRLRNHRIGKQEPGKTRPIKVHLNSHNDVLKAMGNCKHLKNQPNLTKLSVLKDETRNQQQQRKERYIKSLTTNPQPGDKRPAATEERDSHPPNKRPTTTDNWMEA
ncbi:unnamed protein product [Orchesella dallaii]|uniref:Uncharacterized protein n=1 Tax=Orchesella dallaii TaxID=48710 RepID=A0ABP1R271_9HEXA